MRTAALTLLSFVAFGVAAKAQKFSLLPQVGFENSKTSIRYNDISSFSPAGVIFTPQVSLQLNYASKHGHGFFAGAGSSRTMVPFRFADPAAALSDFTTNNGKIQLRFEGGYRYSSKPIYFKKQSKNTMPLVVNKTAEKKSCGSYSYRSNCSRDKSTDALETSVYKRIATNNRGTWVKLQPSMGLGFIPVAKDQLVSVSEGGYLKYEYRSGHMRTALLPGMAFEFGKNNTRHLTVGVNYLHSLGSAKTQSIESMNGTKTVITQLRSQVSGWNLRVGIPFTLGAKKPAIKQVEAPRQVEKKQSCLQYRIRYRCRRTL